MGLTSLAADRHRTTAEEAELKICGTCRRPAPSEAVTEGVTPEAADNLAKLKTDALAAQAAERLAGTDGSPPSCGRRPYPWLRLRWKAPPNNSLRMPGASRPAAHGQRRVFPFERPIDSIY
jgi:hypothetical protein